jgi:serine/threonine-protein kinase HipA
MIIQIRDQKAWRDAAKIEPLEDPRRGPKTSCQLEYEMDYAIDMIDRDQETGSHAISCHYNVNLALEKTARWPAFLFDLFPQGAALKYVVDHYRIADQIQNYWQILNIADISPPGNLRVKLERDEPELTHPGFEKQEVVDKGPEFVEYMVSCGAPASGTTGAGGAAPKFLLREDHQGRFHAEGVLPDHLTKTCWLVKFPRGNPRDSINADILKAESIWYDVAKKVGLNTFGTPEWISNCLFIPRFDRQIIDGELHYHGMESFYSLVDSVEFGSRFRHQSYTDALYQFSDRKEQDLLEYLLRDLLNQVMGNTDNHGRNHSVLKVGNSVCLSPLYDFAPMKFDPEGIARSTRWQDDENFFNEAEILFTETYGLSKQNMRSAIENLWDRLRRIDFKLFDIKKSFTEDFYKQSEMMERKIEKYLRKG